MDAENNNSGGGGGVGDKNHDGRTVPVATNDD